MGAWIPAAIGAAGAIGGALLGPEQEHIGFGDIWGPNSGHALRLMDQAATMPGQQYFQGDQVANFLPAQQQAINQLINWGGGQGQNIFANQYNQGMTGLGALNQGSGFLDQMMGAGAPQFGFDQGTFDQVMGNLMPGMQGLFESGAQDISQNLNWNTLPGLNMEAAMMDMTSGSGLGTNTTLAQNLAQENLRDFGLGLWGNAANAATDAGMVAGRQNMQGYNQNAANFLSGAQGLASQGLPGMSNAALTGIGNIDAMFRGGELRQDQRQEEIDANMAKHFWQQQQPWTDLQNRLALMSNGQMQPSQPAGPNAFGNAISGMQLGLGLYDSGIFDFLNQPDPASTATFQGGYDPFSYNAPST
jgi:hypothetical protein